MLNKVLFFTLFLSSCGLKITNFIEENVLAGSWEMKEINCYNSSRTDILEKYVLPSDVSSEMQFDANDFNYSLTSDTCSTSAVGDYETTFDGDLEDRMDFGSVLSGENCQIDITDTGPSTIGLTTIPFDLYAPAAKDLFWELDDANDTEVLELEIFTNFNGSTNVNGCAGECICLIEYEPAS